MGAGGCQSELEMLLSRVAADLTTLRELIDTLASDDARALLLAPLLRVRSQECAFGLMVGMEEP